MTASKSADPSRNLLDGYTVLDFTRVLAGPYCTRMLADLGARVIKVERPGEGDEVRYSPRQLEPGRIDQSSYFARLNAGKQGIAVDLAHPEAKNLILDLVAQSDVLVENFSPGVMKRYRFDAATLHQIKPELVYCSISGFGQTGPLSSMQAYAHIVNAVSGLMDLDCLGYMQPRASYLQAADVLAGTHAFGAICAALLRRARSGQGATLDVSMLECLIAADDITYISLLNGGKVERRPRPGMVVHPIGDGHIAMQSVGAPRIWLRLVELIGDPSLATDPRFATPQARRDNWADLQKVFATWLDTFNDRNDALAALSSARVPSTPVLSPEEVSEHPQVRERQTFPGMEHPGAGTVRVTSTPFFIDGKPTHPKTRAPYEVGEHTRAVLSGLLGYTHERIERLNFDKVIAIPG